MDNIDTSVKGNIKDYSVDDINPTITLELSLTEKPSKLKPPLQEDIFTSRKHSMDYFTVDGVKLRTGYSNKRDWYLLPIREMLDNGIDFLWKNYKGDNASITVDISKDDNEFRLKIRNTNQKNIPVFSNLGPIFDFDMRYGSKQDVHIISRGMLGDAMKQILSLGYVLIHVDDDGTAFTNKQWEYPLIIRHNGIESHVHLNVDKAQQINDVIINDLSEELTHSDTEIELVLPIIDEVRSTLTRDYIEQFCRKYSLFTTDISFKFRIIDDSTPQVVSAITKEEIIPEFLKALNTTPAKGIVNIDLPALHPISKEWSNTESVHTCKPEEFISRITNVHDKSTSVWKVLLQFKEGTQKKQTVNNGISIVELLHDPDKDDKIKGLYEELKDTLDPADTLSLPYTTNPKKRREALVSRLAKIYDVETDKASYKLVQAFHDGTERGNGIVKYPFAFEILAVPFKNQIGKVDSQFIGAVNYSVSPINNDFKGDYSAVSYVKDINELLANQGFHRRNTKGKIACIIIGNLITPRRDPHGYDKSSLDIGPFADIIITAVEKMAKDIQTYRAAGYHFTSDTSFEHARYIPSNEKITAKSIIGKFLTDEFGLPTK